MDPARRRLRVLSVDLEAACNRAMDEAWVHGAILSNALTGEGGRDRGPGPPGTPSERPAQTSGG